jgi:hypothetical protein
MVEEGLDDRELLMLAAREGLPPVEIATVIGACRVTSACGRRVLLGKSHDGLFVLA